MEHFDFDHDRIDKLVNSSNIVTTKWLRIIEMFCPLVFPPTYQGTFQKRDSHKDPHPGWSYNNIQDAIGDLNSI